MDVWVHSNNLGATKKQFQSLKMLAIGTENIMVSPRGHLDWGGAYIRNLTVVTDFESRFM